MRSAWRALPLTAQLGIIGMVVALAWFIAARTSAVRQEAAQRERSAALAELHAAEVLATRLGSSLTTMSAAYRGYALTGRADFLEPYALAWRTFESGVGTLRERVGARRVVVADIDAVQRMALVWQDSVITRAVALRQSGGNDAFASGTHGAEVLVRGQALLDSVLTLHGQLLRDIRTAVVAAEAEAEREIAFDELESLLVLAAAVVIFLLIGTLLLRFVRRALGQVVTASGALAAGHYADARLPDTGVAPSRELGQLANTFEHLAESIEQRERQLKQDNLKLRELERLKADFVSTVSHELRTPLTSMRGALGLMLGGKAGEVPARGRELLQIAMGNTERLIRLINDILDVEKMDAGQVTVRRELLKLTPMLESTLAGLESLARDARVRLRLESVVDVEVVGDSDRLIQVFTNLVSNAVKFSPPSTDVELTLTTVGDRVTIGVRDHGPGIPAEFAGRIFGRFQQASGEGTHRSGGTGLGLNIAKTIVEMHGGEIGFAPASGGGTVFHVTLPVAQVPALNADARRGILIIEADPLMRDVLVAQLAAIARPLPVGGAEEALALLEHETVAGIILDPGLPGMNDLQFAQRLRADPRLRTLPILIYSSKEYDPAVLRRSGVRAADAFVKTRDAEDVMFDRLRAALRLDQ